MIRRKNNYSGIVFKSSTWGVLPSSVLSITTPDSPVTIWTHLGSLTDLFSSTHFFFLLLAWYKEVVGTGNEEKNVRVKNGACAA